MNLITCKHLKIVLATALSISLLILLISCARNDSDSIADLPANLVSGIIHTERISEASGIAVSTQNPDTLWINNDSGNSATIFGVNSAGRQTVQLDISKTENTDWEDLATFQLNGHAYILVADTGDNYAARDHYQIHIVREPDLSQITTPAHLSVTPEWSITFHYPDGQHDCEAVAVDIRHSKILLLSKREETPILYQLPLKPDGSAKIQAQKLGNIRPLPEPSQTYFRLTDLLGYTKQPTGMDIAPDGSGITVLTYGDAYYYPAVEEQDWSAVLSRKPAVISLPELRQAEGIGFDRNGQNLFVVSEKLPAPLLRISLKPFL
jgi:hypothetical protein